MKVTCEICKKNFENAILLNKHLLHEHNIKSYEYHNKNGNIPKYIQDIIDKIKL